MWLPLLFVSQQLWPQQSLCLSARIPWFSLFFSCTMGLTKFLAEWTSSSLWILVPYQILLLGPSQANPLSQPGSSETSLSWPASQSSAYDPRFLFQFLSSVLQFSLLQFLNLSAEIFRSRSGCFSLHHLLLVDLEDDAGGEPCGGLVCRLYSGSPTSFTKLAELQLRDTSAYIYLLVAS